MTIIEAIMSSKNDDVVMRNVVHGFSDAADSESSEATTPVDESLIFVELTAVVVGK